MTDDTIKLFSVPPGTTFEDEADFRKSLITSGQLEDILQDRYLYVVIALMDYTEPNSLCALLRRKGFIIDEKLGSVWKIHFAPADSGSDQHAFETYVALDWSNGLAVCYTNYRKTSEIDPFLIPVLSRASSHLDLFVLYPSLIQRILDGVSEEFPSARVVEFTAHTAPSTGGGAMGRTGYKRTIRYWGDDGMYAYPELHDLYGTAITSVQVELPEMATKFKLHQKGTVALCSGSPSLLSHIMDSYVLPAARKQRAAIVRTRRQYVTVGTDDRQHRIPFAVPLSIELAHPLSFHKVDRDLEELLKDHRFPALSFLAEEGSLFLSASLVDKDRGAGFDIRASENRIKLLPGSHTGLATLLRFYDFVLEEIDPYATLQT